MIKFILTTVLLIFSTFSFSQTSYPRIERDSAGNKVLVMTIAQAQKIDNDEELFKLLSLEGDECDSLNVSYVKVIDELNKQVALFTIDINALKGQINEKDQQIANLQTQLKNITESNQLCNAQKVDDQKQIDILNKEIKRQKFRKVLGFIVGVTALVLEAIILR
jgi:chaperonin cofactor prefoldin